MGFFRKWMLLRGRTGAVMGQSEAAFTAGYCGGWYDAVEGRGADRRSFGRVEELCQLPQASL